MTEWELVPVDVEGDGFVGWEVSDKENTDYLKCSLGEMDPACARYLLFLRRMTVMNKL